MENHWKTRSDSIYGPRSLTAVLAVKFRNNGGEGGGGVRIYLSSPIAHFLGTMAETRSRESKNGRRSASDLRYWRCAKATGDRRGRASWRSAIARVGNAVDVYRHPERCALF